MSAKKPKRGRTETRSSVRELTKLADARAKLAALEPGGAPSRPLDVESASVIELRARSFPCTRCEGELVLDEHAAIVHGGESLRELRLKCRRCGTPRTLWFRVRPPLTN